MKILGVKFKNINSLKGVHEIRLDKAPFSGSGLFAITGPTGAGKSSILDAITLALYGNAPRHNKAAESMTRHTGEAFAEVEFESGDIIYRARWTIRRSKGMPNGSLQAQKMELSCVDSGEILASHPVSAVQKKIVDISGLDYHQFLRSVMLAQGDFTRFMNAGPNERSELLEKITDTKIYSDISIFVFEKAKEEDRKIQDFDLKLGELKVMTPEELAARKEKLNNISQKVNELKAQSKKLKLQLQWRSGLNEKERDLKNIQTEYENHRLSIQKYSNTFDRLNQHRIASKHQALLERYGLINERILKQEREIQYFHTKLPLIQQEINSLGVKLEEAIILFEKVQEEQKNMEIILPDVEKLDKEILLLQNNVNKLEEEFNILTGNAIVKRNNLAKIEEKKHQLQLDVEQLELSLKAKEIDASLPAFIASFKEQCLRLEDISKETLEKEKAINQTQKRLIENKSKRKEQAELFNKLKLILENNSIKRNTLIEEKAKLLQNVTYEELEDKFQQMPNIIICYKKLLEISSTYNMRLIDLPKFSQLLKKLCKEEEKVSMENFLLEKEIKITEELLDELKRNYEMQLLIQKYEDDRLKLLQGEACPLCGSIEHPYMCGILPESKSEVEKKYQNKQTQYKELLAQFQRNQLDHSKIQNRILDGSEKIENLKKEITKYESDFLQYSNSLPETLEIVKTKDIENLLKSKEEEYNKQKTILTNIRTLIEQIRFLENDISKKREEQLLLTATIKQLENEETNFEDFLKRQEEELQISKTYLNTLSIKLESELGPYGFGFDKQGLGTILKELEKRLNNYQILNHTLQENIIMKGKLDSDCSNARLNIETDINKINNLELNLLSEKEILTNKQQKRFSLFGDKVVSIERKKLEREVLLSKDHFHLLKGDLQKKQQEEETLRTNKQLKESELEIDKNQFSSIKAKLEEDIAKDNITSIDELRSKLLTEMEVAEIEKVKLKSETKSIELQHSIKDLLSKIAEEKDLNLGSAGEDELTISIKETDDQIEQYNQTIGTIHESLHQYARLKEQINKLLVEKERQQKVQQRWKQLSSLIGSADGKSFRNFAQGLTLVRLTTLANKHLALLSDRYEIEKMSGGILELQIKDNYQAGIHRPLNTLSGGESFLVSLALALGLSELAGRKVRIGSLFIDEGFGSLDEETLDIAITALENLQIQGKSIGIISHIPELNERIYAKIQVEKHAGGYSTIHIPNL